MTYYVSQTLVSVVDGKLTATETILTKPDKLAPTTETFRRMERCGIPHIAVCKHAPKRYKKLMSGQNKRRKDRMLTKAEVAEIIEELNRDAS